jgi:hypothetical protein
MAQLLLLLFACLIGVVALLLVWRTQHGWRFVVGALTGVLMAVGMWQGRILLREFGKIRPPAPRIDVRVDTAVIPPVPPELVGKGGCMTSSNGGLWAPCPAPPTPLRTSGCVFRTKSGVLIPCRDTTHATARR